MIDELRHEVQVKGDEPRETYGLSDAQRGMLWLVVTHIGDRIRHKDIRRLFWIHGAQSDNAVYQYPLQLRDLLGEELRRRVMGPGKKKMYPIQSVGWSFVWARPSLRTDTSELIEGLPGMPFGN